jgi:hypothetical protein
VREFAYVNTPTKLLLDAVGNFIAEHHELSQHPQVINAFDSLQAVSREVSAFVRYVAERINASSDPIDLTPRQMTLIQFYFLLHTLSTYAAIPLVVAHLHLIGDYQRAALINANAAGEGGGKGVPSHHELLTNSLRIIAKQVGALPVTAKRLIAAMRIYELHDIISSQLEDHVTLWTRLKSHRPFLPISRKELPIAIEIAALLNENMLHYHRHIQKTLLTPTAVESSYKRFLALATLELAKREAESVDEISGNRSFIGAWEQIVESYKDRLTPDAYREAVAWSRAYNSAEEAAKAGWQDTSTVDGHARDAREVALHFLTFLNPSEFAHVLERVTENADMRLQHWKFLVASLKNGTNV